MTQQQAAVERAWRAWEAAGRAYRANPSPETDQALKRAGDALRQINRPAR